MFLNESIVKFGKKKWELRTETESGSIVGEIADGLPGWILQEFHTVISGLHRNNPWRNLLDWFLDKNLQKNWKSKFFVSVFKVSHARRIEFHKSQERFTDQQLDCFFKYCWKCFLNKSLGKKSCRYPGKILKKTILWAVLLEVLTGNLFKIL